VDWDSVVRRLQPQRVRMVKATTAVTVSQAFISTALHALVSRVMLVVAVFTHENTNVNLMHLNWITKYISGLTVDIVSAAAANMTTESLSHTLIAHICTIFVFISSWRPW